MKPFLALIDALDAARVRFVLIGVAGANYYAPRGGATFYTQDRDLFLPLDAVNLLAAWSACERTGFEMTTSSTPLDRPRDHWLAEQVISRRALTTGVLEGAPPVDLTLIMAGFEFEDVWRERRVFVDEGLNIPVARLLHIVESKARAGRAKDHYFLTAHGAELSRLMPADDPPRTQPE